MGVEMGQLWRAMKKMVWLWCVLILGCTVQAKPGPEAKAGPRGKQPATVPVGAMSVVTTQPTTLFNQWKLTPAGAQAAMTDMPLKMAFSPDGKMIAAVCAGHRPGLAIVDVAKRETIQFVHLPRTFNGLAFSKDGRSIFVT